MGGHMQAFNFKKQLCAIALLLLSSVGASVQAATLSVHCGATSGLTSINAAFKALQSFESERPNTINVSGACHENVVIIQNNRNRIVAQLHSFLNTNATIVDNGPGGGVFLNHNSTLNCSGCRISGNGGIGLIVRRDSSARFSEGYVITGNAGGGVLL